MVRDRVHGTLALSAKAVAVILCLGAPPILLGTYFYKAKCVEYSIWSLESGSLDIVCFESVFLES
jgi:hypothetical protein